MERIRCARMAEALLDSLQRFDQAGYSPGGNVSKNRLIRSKSSECRPQRAASLIVIHVIVINSSVLALN